MSTTIDIGIDLGTTNSAIAQFRRGDVEVFRNPRMYGQSTLPSVVAFRKDKIEVGSKAREFAEKRPGDAFGAFKRRMGSNETYQIRSLKRSVTPVELSAHVLKELKTFVQSGAPLDAAVITIPASFDTIQSNATQQAGKLAGFNQVVLLQEPIAASLAFANKAAAAEQLKVGRWLVYDLGGGTFDVALVEIRDGEMKVVDHEGDNFLGGTDFDRIIVERFLVPHLDEAGQFDDLETQLKSERGRLNAKYLGMLYRSEAAKIELSGATSAEIEVSIDDDDGRPIELTLSLTRSELDDMIRGEVDRTIEMVRSMLARNNMQYREVQFVLMVGGSTYMPHVRQRVGEVLGIPINCDIDPTTAIAIGAAYYAGTKLRESGDGAASRPSAAALRIRAAYHKASQEDSEFFAAQIDGDVTGLMYRIFRDDGGFDTGVKPLQSRISEDLPLVPEAYNYFTLAVTDAQGNAVPTGFEPIGIAHGKVSVAGQPLPHDISLERDDEDTKDTYLELLFRKNETLPLRRSVTYPLNRTIVKGSRDSIRVRVLEGPHWVHPDSNQCIGHLEISGAMLSRDAVRGSDVEITVEMSESRELKTSVHLAMTDQEFTEVFRGLERATPVPFLREIATSLSERLEEEVDTATEAENYELVQELRALQREAEGAAAVAESLSSDDVTDQKYQVEDRVRNLNQQLDVATRDKRIQKARKEYNEALDWCRGVVTEGGNDLERRRLDEIVGQERVFLTSANPLRIQEMIDELNRLAWAILWRTPQFLAKVFGDLMRDVSRMNDQPQAKNLVAAGQHAIENGNWDRLKEVNFGLLSLLPTHEREVYAGRIGF
jgi:molecular chaperone DnaK